jgi:hypothetical protein
MAIKKAVKGSSALVKWDDRFAKYAAEAKAKTGTPTGQFVGSQGGVFTVDKVPVPNNELVCVVMDSIFENALYDGDFDSDNPQPPVCFALGVVEADLAPHELSEEPQVGKGSPNPESTCCADCPNNEWGSADTGRGRACKNGRRIGIIAGDSVETGVLTAGVHYLKVPPTSLAAWDQYVKQMADTLHRPPFALVTSIKLVPPPPGKLGFRYEIKLKQRIEDMNGVDEQVFSDLEAKHLQVAEAIGFPYQPMSAEDRAAARQPNKSRGAARFTRQAAAAPAAKKKTRFTR